MKLFWTSPSFISRPRSQVVQESSEFAEKESEFDLAEAFSNQKISQERKDSGLVDSFVEIARDMSMVVEECPKMNSQECHGNDDTSKIVTATNTSISTPPPGANKGERDESENYELKIFPSIPVKSFSIGFVKSRPPKLGNWMVEASACTSLHREWVVPR